MYKTCIYCKILKFVQNLEFVESKNTRFNKTEYFDNQGCTEA